MNKELMEQTNLKEIELQKRRAEVLKRVFGTISFANKLEYLRFFVVSFLV